VLPIILFVVAARARLPHVIFAISPAIGNFHQLGDSFRLLAAEFFDVRFSSDTIAEGVDCSINRDIFSNIQEFGEPLDVRTHRLFGFC
jgi:hypothetical protein